MLVAYSIPLRLVRFQFVPMMYSFVVTFVIPIKFQADCFLLCYAIDNSVSYENAATKWVPEIKTDPPVPIVLLGKQSPSAPFAKLKLICSHSTIIDPHRH